MDFSFGLVCVQKMAGKAYSNSVLVLKLQLISASPMGVGSVQTCSDQLGWNQLICVFAFEEVVELFFLIKLFIKLFFLYCTLLWLESAKTASQ